MKVRKTAFCFLLTLAGFAAAVIDKGTGHGRSTPNQLLSESSTGKPTMLGNQEVVRYHFGDNLPYFPKGTDFPLSNELNAQLAEEAENCAKSTWKSLKPGDPIPGMPEYFLGTVLPTPGFIRDGDGCEHWPKPTDFPLQKELNAQQTAESDAAERLAR